MPTVTRINFSAKVVGSFQCEAGKKSSYLYDAAAPGLGLRVSRGGTRAYFFEGRVNGKGNPIRVTIGNIKDWPLADAQKRARELRMLADRGLDPRQVEADQLKQTEDAARESRRASVTFEEAWQDYLIKVKEDSGAKHYDSHLSLSAPGGEPKKRGKGLTIAGPLAVFRPRRLVDLHATDIVEWLARESKVRPSSVEHAYRLLRAFGRWTAEEDSQYAGLLDSAVWDAKSVKTRVPKPRARKDCLQREQLKPWFEAVLNLPNPVHGAYLQSQLLTGARREEMAGLRWVDIDFQWRKMTIRDKINKFRDIPLTPYVAHLLSSLPRDTEFVFASPTAADGTLSEPRFPLETALEAAGLPHLTVQGLRRSFGTLAEWVECPAGVVAQIMGHAPSALAEKHYRVRPIDMLRMWHERIEQWILHEAGLDAAVPATAKQSRHPPIEETPMTSSPLPDRLAAQYAGQTGPEAMHRLLTACFSHHGGSTVPVAQFLISLYNARYTQLDAALLCRRLSDDHFEDTLAVMRWYRSVAGRLDEWGGIYGAAGYSVPTELARRFSSEIVPEHQALFSASSR